jgi:hypothetical protein
MVVLRFAHASSAGRCVIPCVVVHVLLAVYMCVADVCPMLPNESADCGTFSVVCKISPQQLTKLLCSNPWCNTNARPTHLQFVHDYTPTNISWSATEMLMMPVFKAIPCCCAIVRSLSRYEWRRRPIDQVALMEVHVNVRQIHLLQNNSLIVPEVVCTIWATRHHVKFAAPRTNMQTPP